MSVLLYTMSVVVATNKRLALHYGINIVVLAPLRNILPFKRRLIAMICIKCGAVDQFIYSDEDGTPVCLTCGTSARPRTGSPPPAPSDWVNAHQTREERSLKYHLCRLAGWNVAWAGSMRDWSWHSILRRVNNAHFEK
jgi:hypothetical protein